MTTMELNLDDKTKRALKRVDDIARKNGFEVRMVGGAVRDMILGKEPKDVDLATPARPEVVMRAFSNEILGLEAIPTGIKHGTVTVVVDHVPFEVTTLRLDKETDGRRATVEFTDDWALDAARRDFTGNAIYMGFDGRIYDYFNGKQDLLRGTLRFVGDPNDRIQEDYLRILRFFRFYAAFERPDAVPPFIVEAITKNSRGLEQISGERIWAELTKILAGPSRTRSLVAMHMTGVAQSIELPTPTDGILFIQNRPDATWLHALAALIRNEENLDKVHKRWKFDTNSFRILKFVIKNRKTKLDEAWVDNHMVTDGNRSLAWNIAAFQGNMKLVEYIKTFPETIKFPVNGNDVKALGYEGRDIATALDDMKRKWAESKFTLTRDELLTWMESDQNV